MNAVESLGMAESPRRGAGGDDATVKIEMSRARLEPSRLQVKAVAPAPKYELDSEIVEVTSRA